MPCKPHLKSPPGALARPDYQPGDYLRADDLRVGQDYLEQRLRRHDRRLHGWGVVCGMRVIPANDPAHPWGVCVCPGFAIGPYGDEIQLTCRVSLDITEFLWLSPIGARAPRVTYVAIRYAEELTKPTPTPTAQCQCSDTVYTPSRIQDGYQLSALWELALQLKQPRFDIYRRESAPLEECPPSPYLILAHVNLPPTVGQQVVAANIVNV
jgi:hypothetical protein